MSSVFNLFFVFTILKTDRQTCFLLIISVCDEDFSFYIKSKILLNSIRGVKEPKTTIFTNDVTYLNLILQSSFFIHHRYILKLEQKVVHLKQCHSDHTNQYSVSFYPIPFKHLQSDTNYLSLVKRHLSWKLSSLSFRFLTFTQVNFRLEAIN